MTLTSKLARISAMCREVIALAERATPGEWTSGRTSYGIPAVFPAATNSAIATFGTYKQGEPPYFLHNHSANAAFIAATRTLTPALARATIAVIDELLPTIEYDVPVVREHTVPALQAIADAFTEEELG